jgi:hypothetical protein
MSDSWAFSRRGALRLSAAAALVSFASPALALAAAHPALAVAKAGLGRVGGRVARREVVGVADFGRPSSDGRLHLVDMASGQVTSLLVAHGRGSDPAHTGWLSRFSNTPGSDCTSEGAYLTGADYVGEHGPSMRLIGLDPSNDNAEPRAIVVHSAVYVGPEILRAHGVLGRSNGCFAVSQADLPQVLRRLPTGSLLVAAKL